MVTKRESSPLISINIPTLNSEKTLERTLKSIINQTYKNCEIVIIDGESQDSTIELAKKYTDKIYLDRGKLLSARYKGFEESKGDFIVLLDSDQVLQKTSLERAVDLINKKGFDMLFLEENSYMPRTIVEKLTAIDRKLIHKKSLMDPSRNVLLPRLFKKSILQAVFDKIDKGIFNQVTLQDHAIIYYEAYKISRKVGILSSAVFHEEPSTVSELFRHYFIWGVRSEADFRNLPKEYRDMFSGKLNNRLGNVNFNFYFLLAFPVILIKGLGYYAGLMSSKISNGGKGKII